LKRKGERLLKIAHGSWGRVYPGRGRQRPVKKKPEGNCTAIPEKRRLAVFLGTRKGGAHD